MTKSIIFVIKVTHFCNMSCKYCYNKKIHKSGHTIDINLLERIIIWVGKYCKNSNIQKVEFVWHGGEPLLPGVDFYKLVNKLQNTYLHEIKYENGIQTNGTLITEEFIDFFKNNKYKISISLDGDKVTNDKQRIFCNGSGTFDLIMDNISLLKQEEVSLGISAVVHPQNYKMLISNYLFFKKHNLSYNIVFDFNNDYPINYTSDLSRELNAFFDFWCHDYNPLNIRFFVHILQSLLCGKNNECTFSQYCCMGEELLVIDSSGELYPCSIFVGCEKYNYGKFYNISSLEALKKTDSYKNILQLKMNNEQQCNHCAYFKICFGGCFVRYSKNVSKDYYCEVWKNLFSTAEKIVKQANLLKEDYK